MLVDLPCTIRWLPRIKTNIIFYPTIRHLRDFYSIISHEDRIVPNTIRKLDTLLTYAHDNILATEILGKCSGTFVWPSEQFWKIFGTLRKVVGNLRKIVKIVNFMFSCKNNISLVILFMPLEHKIHIFSPPCNILYLSLYCSGRRTRYLIKYSDNIMI